MSIRVFNRFGPSVARGTTFGSQRIRWVAKSFAIILFVLLPNVGLRSLPAGAAALTPSEIVAYKAAFEAAKKRDWTAASQHAAGANRPLARKVLRWLKMTQPDNGYSFQEISDFIDKNPDWPKPKTLRNRAEEAFTESTPPSAVLAFFAHQPPHTTKGKIAFGRALISAGRADEGYLHLRDAWVYGRFSHRDETAFVTQYHAHLTQSDHHERLDNLLWNGLHREARRMLRRVSPGWRALAVARMKLRRRGGAVDHAIAGVPKSLRGNPGLMYERLRWRRRRGRDLDALEILKKPPTDLVRPELWAKEYIILARRLLAHGLVADAYQIVRNHGLDLRQRKLFAEAEWLAGWIALRYKNQGREALQRFEGLYKAVRYPVSQARAAYWAGRAAKVLGDIAQANDWFEVAARHPTTYHGQLATQELGIKIHSSPEPAPPGEAERNRFNNHELANAIRILNQLDQRRLVRTFLLRFSGLVDSPDQKVLAAELARSIDRIDLAVWVARHAQRDGTVMLSDGYPLYQMPEGEPEKALLLAVARQESNFYAHAISRAGARGVMQLMPRTARQVARSSGMGYSRSRLTSDPVYNVRLGRRYLGDMLDKFNGSYVLAVAAYNAGPNAVARWLQKNGDPRNGVDDPIDWIELIPYQETRTYVQRVLGNLQVFRNRLEPGRMAVTLDRDLRR